MYDKRVNVSVTSKAYSFIVKRNAVSMTADFFKALRSSTVSSWDGMILYRKWRYTVFYYWFTY
ncbi:hypothetical protein WN48_02251 [Eufriesea mexicana]|uniref:Uncharacterized protein n=1 Tax=Eufriesea mexicana TaxID=516756 RepID=A0A310SC55_9HYME|nr:hypothetical protein WN48_02251 [Eufriesea mexicana]